MRSLSFAALLSFIALNGAFAQKYEFTVTGGYTKLSKTDLGSLPTSEDQAPEDTKLKGEYTYGVRFTVNTKGYYGHEFGYSMSRARLTSVFRGTNELDVKYEIPISDRIRIGEASYNFLMYMMPRDEWIRPYVTAGAETFHFSKPSSPNWTAADWRTFGFNWGGGLKFKAGRMLLRLDFRDYIVGKPYGLEYTDFNRTGGLYHSMQGTAGLGFGF